MSGVALAAGLAVAAAVAALPPWWPAARPVGRPARGTAPVAAVVARALAAVTAVGAVARRGLRRPPDAEADARWGRAAALGVLVAVVGHPVLGVAVGVATWAQPVVAARRRRQAQQREVVAGLPEAVDLLRVAVGAGLTVPLAVPAVAPHLHGPLAEALAQAARRASLGVPWPDALEALRPLGEPVRPLVGALVAATRHGAPLDGPLAQVARDGRLARRRAAEEAARRLPVRLLFPLVLCTLPAFGLLTVAPLLADTLGSLPL